jgi:hypothetical protein
MRLTLFTAVALSLISGLLPGCDRTTPEPPAKDGSASSGQSAAGAATGQASEGSTDDRKAPARPSSRY